MPFKDSSLQKEYILNWRKETTDKLKEYFKNYKELNKENIKQWRSEKCECDKCDKTFTRGHKSDHMKLYHNNP